MILIASLALAGKLADGWRGHEFGDSKWMVNAPSEGCVQNPEAEVAWRCYEKAGEAEFTANYMVEGDTYTGVPLQCKEYTNCAALRSVLLAAWGRPFSVKDYGTLPDTMWGDENVLAGWSYNQFLKAGTVTVFDKEIYDRLDRAKKAEAAKAAEAL